MNWNDPKLSADKFNLLSSPDGFEGVGFLLAESANLRASKRSLDLVATSGLEVLAHEPVIV